MASVRLEQVRKVYGADGREHVAVRDLTFEVADGEFVVIVGPSGCGKSTTLRMIAGLESVTSGRIMIGDRTVNRVRPKDRDIAMVFQNYALYPHMSAFDNMGFGLRLRKLEQAEIERRVRGAAEKLGLTEVLNRKPKELSGGQRQRVALGRAIVREPSVFLFDEPLSNLDAKLRVQMRAELAHLHRELGTTMVYVTHDQVEAMTMGDRILVLLDGRLQQYDAPLDLYNRPANRFVAGFIGSPSMNFIEGRVAGDGQGGSGLVSDGGVRLALPPSPALEEGRVVSVGIRPEALRLAEPGAGPGGAGRLRGELELAEPMGNETFVYVRAGDSRLVARVPPRALPEPGQPVELAVSPDRLHVFDAESGRVLAHAAPAYA